ncbi:MAG: phosphoglycerate dehydrogenase, partial [Planctomycetota bacterium]
DNAAALFEREGFRVSRHSGAADPAELAALIASAHVIGIRSKTRLVGEALGAARRLLAVGCFCIGTNQVDLVSAAGAGVPVFNAPFSNTRSVAELTVAEVVMLHRRAFERSSQMHAGRWVKSASGAHEVRGRTLGIVGYGHIGAQVSVLAESMGLRVLFYDVIPKLPLGNARQTGSLDELLRESDVVTLHVPATDGTSGLIGAAEIENMKPGGHLINNARGSVVDLAALADALRRGRLGGAAIDVFPEEPSSREAAFRGPLVGLENVILTPHIAGSTQEAQASIAEEVGNKLLRFVNAGATTGAVNVPEVEPPPQRGMVAPGTDERPHRILHFHRNVPGVLSKINNAVSDLGVNVASQTLRTDGEIGYAVLDVAPSDGEQLRARMDAIEGTIRTRVLW